MSQPTPLDITNMPELVRLAEEVEATKKPRVLKRDNTALAILMPVKKKQSHQAKRKEAILYELFASSALRLGTMMDRESEA